YLGPTSALRMKSESQCADWPKDFDKSGIWAAVKVDRSGAMKSSLGSLEGLTDIVGGRSDGALPGRLLAAQGAPRSGRPFWMRGRSRCEGYARTSGCARPAESWSF